MSRHTAYIYNRYVLDNGDERPTICIRLMCSCRASVNLDPKRGFNAIENKNRVRAGE